LRKDKKEDGMSLRTGEGTGNKRGIIRSHSVKNSIWKGLWTSGKSENRIIMFIKMMIMMMIDGDVC
jgi:hypothetical protein